MMIKDISEESEMERIMFLLMVVNFRDYPQFCVNSKLQEPNPSLDSDSVFKYFQKLIKN